MIDFRRVVSPDGDRAILPGSGMDDDEVFDGWTLDRQPDQSDADYAADVEMWRRWFASTDRDGVAMGEHLSSGRAVLVEIVTDDIATPES